MKKNTIIKDALMLFIITLIAGVALGFVYDITKEPIKEAEERAKQKAYQKVFTQAAEFVENETLTQNVEESKAFFTQKEVTGVTISEVLEAKDSAEETIGYVLSVVANEGYGGDITFSLGIDKNGRLTGFEVLSMSETAGLGERCTKDEFKSQFAGMQAKQITYSKTGKQAANEIDALSGATITTKAITKAVNGALTFIQEFTDIIIEE